MYRKLFLLILVLALAGTNVAFGQIVWEGRISSGSDDYEQYVSNGDMDSGSSDLEITEEGDPASNQLIGLRFNGVVVPQGANITSAYVQFHVDETDVPGDNRPGTKFLRGEAVDNAAAFLDVDNNMSSRPTTSAEASWDWPLWETVDEEGPDQQTSDISAVIQEIVDRPGWSPGNSLVLIITGSGENTAEAFEGEPDAAALLHIEYSSDRAVGPEPANGSIYLDTWASLSWTPGDTASSSDVYFSDNLADVEARAEAAFQGNHAGAFLVVGFPGMPYPDGLVPGTTYYWLVDSIKADGITKYEGKVWSFTIAPKTAYSPEPADGAELVNLNERLSWQPGFGSKLHTIYFGNSFDEVDTAAGGLPQAATEFSPGELVMAKTYYWRVDEFDVLETHKGDVWSFTTIGAVEALDPANGAVDVSQLPTLTWTPGVFADSHEVYFGTDASSLELKGSGNLGSESYEPGQLEWNTTYYWRIDEANNTHADSPWTGNVWSFTTANFLIIDDMEGYNDLDPADPTSNRIFNAWIDGFGDPTNGSLVGYANPPFAEQTIVHSGNQSMPFEYDNAAGKSEATLTLTANRDWTVNGVDTLTIWHRGAASNAAETMYVTLNGSASVDNDNPDAALAGWTEWNIPLQAFADQGVNLSNVTSITLGLRSGTGGTGMLYFDDIRLYPPAP